ncbi:MAG TPA: redoxin domain-containing protein [Planctomycetes bacterium]|nr:redoxin domain-containing protein [Planctomycetota bacterium]
MKQYKDKPFAIVGVNTDKDRAALSQMNAKAGITWRSFWNGEKGTGGPISQAWNVAGYPTMFLLDHNGVILNRWLGSPGNDVLDAAIEKAVKVAEQDQARAPRQKQSSVDDIIAQYDSKMKRFGELYEKAETDEEKAKLFKESYPEPATYIDDLWAAVRRAEGTEEAARGLAWILSNSRDAEDKAKAMDVLMARHSDSPSLGKVCSWLVWDHSEAAAKFLDTLATKSPHREVRGAALLAKAAKMRRDGAASKDALALLRTLAKDYADVPHPWAKEIESYTTIGAAAEREIFELENLVVGKPAPDIVGKDLDGVEFKLSDYRGKVVMLDFWGDW